MFKDVTARFDQSDIAAHLTVAAIANIPIFFWLPLVKCRDSAFARYNANHGVWFLILSVVGSWLFRLLPLFGRLLSDVYATALMVLWIFMVIHTLRGTAKEIPFISETKIIK